MPTQTAIILGRLPRLPLAVLATYVAQRQARQRREQVLAALAQRRGEQRAA
jgi:hypothetical protein